MAAAAAGMALAAKAAWRKLKIGGYRGLRRRSEKLSGVAWLSS